MDEEGGFGDPYVVIRCAGSEVKSSVIESTSNPHWDVSLTQTVELPFPLPLAPPITVLVYDKDTLSEFMSSFNMHHVL